MGDKVTRIFQVGKRLLGRGDDVIKVGAREAEDLSEAAARARPRAVEVPPARVPDLPPIRAVEVPPAAREIPSLAPRGDAPTASARHDYATDYKPSGAADDSGLFSAADDALPPAPRVGEPRPIGSAADEAVDATSSARAAEEVAGAPPSGVSRADWDALPPEKRVEFSMKSGGNTAASLPVTPTAADIKKAEKLGTSPEAVAEARVQKALNGPTGAGQGIMGMLNGTPGWIKWPLLGYASFVDVPFLGGQQNDGGLIRGPAMTALGQWGVGESLLGGDVFYQRGKNEAAQVGVETVNVRAAEDQAKVGEGLAQGNQNIYDGIRNGTLNVPNPEAPAPETSQTSSEISLKNEWNTYTQSDSVSQTDFDTVLNLDSSPYAKQIKQFFDKAAQDGNLESNEINNLSASVNSSNLPSEVKQAAGRVFGF